MNRHVNAIAGRLSLRPPQRRSLEILHRIKEGWDVTNLYTIVPLRAANARILIEQSIGRGLRLPYGKRTGVTAIDRLSIVAHDKFQEIVDEANKPDSAIRMQAVVLDPDELVQKTKTVVSQSGLASQLGLQPGQISASTEVVGSKKGPAFNSPAEQKIAHAAYEAIKKLENEPGRVPSTSYLTTDEIQSAMVQEVERQLQPEQLEMEGVTVPPDIAAIVRKTAELVIRSTIDIPRILVVPKGEVKSGFKAFRLDLSSLRYPPISEELWVQMLRTAEVEVIGLGKGGIKESRLDDYVVSGLIDFDDIAYEQHADLLYDLAAQTVNHFQGYLSAEETRKVLWRHQREIATFIHAQMQGHYWEDPDVEYEVVISKGFTELKPSAYTAPAAEDPRDFLVAPEDKSKIGSYVFGGFKRCLYPVQKFQSDPERVLAVILDRESEKWFKPSKGQFQIFYKSGADHPEYQPDFVAETPDTIHMLEPKRRKEMKDPDVLAKKEAAEKWCRNASDHSEKNGGKPWIYSLIPHDTISENMTIKGLAGMAPE